MKRGILAVQALVVVGFAAFHFLSLRAPTSLPLAPFALEAPPPPASQLGDDDLRTIDARMLAAGARGAGRRSDWALAVQLQHWAVAGGFPGQYDLACYLSRSGAVDAAIYWLQRAALEEGIDADWASKDADLANLRADERWRRLNPFIAEAQRYWAASGTTKTVIVVPTGYTKDRPIPVVVGLHGFGSRPEDFAGQWAQSAADDLGVAIVSVSATVPLGPTHFRWSESLEQDSERIDKALEEARAKLTVAEGKVVLIGFSQGAQMSAELAARNPARYAGAIVLSPGTTNDLSLEGASASLAGRRFVVSVGGGEHPANVSRAAADAGRLRALGGEVRHKVYEDQKTHSFPADFEDAFREWVQFILTAAR